MEYRKREQSHNIRIELTGESHPSVPYFVLIMLHVMTTWHAHQAQASYGLQNATEHSGQRQFTPSRKLAKHYELRTKHAFQFLLHQS